MAKAKPRTGEARKTRQPLKIDRLPVSVHDAILDLRNRQGKTWEEIERLSAEPAGKGKPGFVEWQKLDTDVLEMFPERRIPHTNLHRWYDIRVAQVSRDTLQRAAQAREIAESFAKSVVANDDEAVLNAARDTFMQVLAEDGTPKGRASAAKALVVLGEVMQTARRNDIRERQVAIEERRIAQLEKDNELKRKRVEQETESAAKKLKKGELSLDDINKLRRNTFGLPPVDENGEVVSE